MSFQVVVLLNNVVSAQQIRVTSLFWFPFLECAIAWTPFSFSSRAKSFPPLLTFQASGSWWITLKTSTALWLKQVTMPMSSGREGNDSSWFTLSLCCLPSALTVGLLLEASIGAWLNFTTKSWGRMSTWWASNDRRYFLLHSSVFTKQLAHSFAIWWFSSFVDHANNLHCTERGRQRWMGSISGLLPAMSFPFFCSYPYPIPLSVSRVFIPFSFPSGKI